MLGISTLWNAVTSLAANLTALAATVAEVNLGVRARLQLDGQAESPALLEGPAEVATSSNGRRKVKAAE